MTYDDAFLQAIIDEPNDDTPRLIYADWLEENGRLARAEFIRAQIEAATLPAEEPRRREREARAEVLLRVYEREWLGPLRAWLVGWQFQRGFVARVAVKAQMLLKHGDTIFQLAPIRHAEIRSAERFGSEVVACSHLTRLTSLRIHKLFAADTFSLIASPYLSSLTALDLRENGIGDGAAEALASSALLARLVQLNLSRNSIHDAGVQALAQSPHANQLEWLDLTGNDIKDAGAMALAESKALAQLHVLRLWPIWIEEEAKERLRARFGDRVQFV